jgi:hypothetical protein
MRILRYPDPDPQHWENRHPSPQKMTGVRSPQCRPCLWQQSQPRVPGPARLARIWRHLERFKII